MTGLVPYTATTMMVAAGAVAAAMAPRSTFSYIELEQHQHCCNIVDAANASQTAMTRVKLTFLARRLELGTYGKQ